MEIHEIEGHIQSIYLAVYPRKILLLDGCCRCDVATVKNYIEKQLKRNFSHLKMILVTHMHPDHAGGVGLFQQKYGIPTASSFQKKQWYHGVSGIFYHLIDVGLAYWVAHRMGKDIKYLWYDRTIKPDFYLKHGDSIPGFPEWSILETPGHTDRDISIYHKISKTIYVADNILKVKSRFIPPFPVNYPLKFKKSLELYQRMQPHKILMAHGGMAPYHDECIAELFPLISEQQSYLKIMRGILKSLTNKTG